MLLVSPKISLVILSVWIHVVVSDYTCDRGFSIGPNNTGLCRGLFADRTAHEYSCALSSCRDGGQPWSPMSGCKPSGSSGSGTNQKCATYDYNKSTDDYTCHNTQGKVYTCPDTPANVPGITCTQCTKKNWKIIWKTAWDIHTILRIRERRFLNEFCDQSMWNVVDLISISIKITFDGFE